jgi:hypothetical protein
MASSISDGFTMRGRRWRAGAAVALAAGALGASAASPASAATTTVAADAPSGLVQSTANLYWTSTRKDQFGPDQAVVMRASKDSTPGLERALYSELRADSFSFGKIVWAFTTDHYAYFVANYNTLGSSRIKRVPLAGGTAVSLVSVPRIIGQRDLRTDGIYLYWADSLGLQRVAIGGGVPTTLVSGSNFSAVALGSHHVYYSAGSQVRRVLKSGGAPTTIVSRLPVVRALDVAQTSSGTVVYSGWSDGLVRSDQPVPDGTVSATLQASNGRNVTSVSSGGAYVAWADCNASGSSCVARWRTLTSSLVSSVNAGVGAGFIQRDDTRSFWGNASAVMRHTP